MSEQRVERGKGIYSVNSLFQAEAEVCVQFLSQEGLWNVQRFVGWVQVQAVKRMRGERGTK
jgi:hypothetical protein